MIWLSQLCRLLKGELLKKQYKKNLFIKSLFYLHLQIQNKKLHILIKTWFIKKFSSMCLLLSLKVEGTAWGDIKNEWNINFAIKFLEIHRLSTRVLQLFDVRSRAENKIFQYNFNIVRIEILHNIWTMSLQNKNSLVLDYLRSSLLELCLSFSMLVLTERTKSNSQFYRFL